MNQELSLSDSAFADSLTTREAYLCMFEFLRAHYALGPWPEIGDLLSMLSLLDDGGSADNAMLHDWLDAVKAVRQAELEGGYTEVRMRLQ